MTTAQLEYLLSVLRKHELLRSNSRSVPRKGVVTDISESDAQWLLKNGYVVYQGQDADNRAIWRKTERIR